MYALEKLLEVEKKNAENQLDYHKKSLSDKNRLAEITDWEYDRNTNLKKILKNLIYALLLIIIILYLKSRGILPQRLSNVIITIIVAVFFIYSGKNLLNNFSRDDRYYDKFNYNTDHLNDPNNPFVTTQTDESDKKGSLFSQCFKALTHKQGFANINNNDSIVPSNNDDNKKYTLF